MTRLNLIIPSSYAEMTQRQLFYAMFLLSAGKYTPDEVKTMAIIRFAELDISQSGNGTYLVVYNKKKYNIRSYQIAEALPAMDWILEIPDYPVRVKYIQGVKALYNDYMNGLEFEKYLTLENLYQGFLHTQDYSLITDMATLLYGKKMKLSAPEAYSIFFWFASLKKCLSAKFNHFFVSSPVSEASTDLASVGRQLEKQMNTQIRALTKGDITKEKEILSMDMWRAFAELDAQAEEYEQMKKQLKQ